jgi:hypothetical protein
MRRLWVLVLGVALLIPLAAPAASGRPMREQSRSYNAFWYLTREVDSDTYLNITWYAGVYESGDGFWSDLYRYVERCERRPGRDRCRRGAYMVGVIEDLSGGTFTLDQDLTSGVFEATYPMEIYRNGHERRVGRIGIAVNLAGTGDLSTSRETSYYEEGCLRVRYSGRWQYRQASAAGTLTFHRTGGTLELAATEDANMAQGRSMTITHEC